MDSLMIAVEKAALDELTRKVDLLMSNVSFDNFERPMNVEQAADFLKISRRTLYEYMNNKDLPFHKMGSQTRFFRSELTNWLKQN